MTPRALNHATAAALVFLLWPVAEAVAAAEDGPRRMPSRCEQAFMTPASDDQNPDDAGRLRSADSLPVQLRGVPIPCNLRDDADCEETASSE